MYYNEGVQSIQSAALPNLPVFSGYERGQRGYGRGGGGNGTHGLGGGVCMNVCVCVCVCVRERKRGALAYGEQSAVRDHFCVPCLCLSVCYVSLSMFMSVVIEACLCLFLCLVMMSAFMTSKRSL